MKHLLILLVLCSAVLNGIQAQQKLRSTKLLKDQGIEELFQITPSETGFLALGMKGTEAGNRQLWLIEMDAKMQVTKSSIAHSTSLNHPFKTVRLPSGKTILLAQDESNSASGSVLLAFNKKSDIEWSRTLFQNESVEFCDLTTNLQGELFLLGKQKMKSSLAYDRDYLLLVKMSAQGQVVWQRKLDLGHLEINPRQLILDQDGNLTVSMNLISPVTEDKKIYKKYWSLCQFNESGRLLNQFQIQNFAYYGQANGIILEDGKYYAVLNDVAYFGKSLLLILDQRLNVQDQFEIEGSPVLCSGIMKQGHSIILGSVFSNTVQDYAPGYMKIDLSDMSVTAKSSPSLFKHFFITQISSLPDAQFMLSGIGYAGDEASDIYLMPFTQNGESACQLNAHEIRLKRNTLPGEEMLSVFVKPASLKSSNHLLQMSPAAYDLSDICTAPDDYVIHPDQNINWSQWEQNNKKAFTIEAPLDWLSVSPNPASDKVTVTYSGMSGTDVLQLTVFDGQSKMVHRSIIRNQDIFEVDIRGYAKGIYYFIVYDGRETKTVKVIKE